MERTAVILAGGLSSRFGQEKGLLNLASKPLIEHVVDKVNDVAQEIIVVVSSNSQADEYARILKSKATIQVDAERLSSPLLGAFTGFNASHGEYTLLLPCDTPFVSKEVISLLFELCIGKTATIPRWPNCFIEPLQAVYRTQSASKAAGDALREGHRNMQAMIDKLLGIRYISTLVLRQIDPLLQTFFNVNTPVDLKRAEAIVKAGRTRPF